MFDPLLNGFIIVKMPKAVLVISHEDFYQYMPKDIIEKGFKLGKGYTRTIEKNKRSKG